MRERNSRRLNSTFAALAMLAAAAAAGNAGPLEDAKAAHERGDDETAVRLIRPLAEQGNATPRPNSVSASDIDGAGALRRTMRKRSDCTGSPLHKVTPAPSTILD